MLTRYFSLISFSIIGTAKCHVWGKKKHFVKTLYKKTHIFLKLCFFQILRELRMAVSGCLSGVTRSRSSASGVQETPESPGYDSTIRETRSVRQGTSEMVLKQEYIKVLLNISRCRSHPECW